MKIVHVINGLGPGGKERQLLYLVKSLVKEHESHVILLSQELFYKEIAELPVEISMVPRSSRYSVATLIRLYRILKRISPHLIHTWDNMSHCLVLPYIVFNKVKVVNSSIRFGGKIKKSLLARAIQKLAFSTSDAIVCNSKSGFYVEKLDKSRKAMVIHNGIDGERFTAATNEGIGIPANGFPMMGMNIVMVARFGAAKDYATFIKAARIVLGIYPKTGFYCIGDGPGRKEAETEAGDWLGKNIFFLGQRNDVHRILQNMDVGVLTNDTRGHAEGMANAILEYMAAGLPVIATDAGGNPEIIQNGITGYLVPAFDPEMVADRIIELMQNKDMRLKMGEKGKEAVKEKFSIEKMGNEYDGLYMKLVYQMQGCIQFKK